MTQREGDLAYWRALAEERQQRIKALEARLLAAIDSMPDAQVRPFVTALDVSRPAWLRDLDFMTASTTLEPAEVNTVLDDLRRRVAADANR